MAFIRFLIEYIPDRSSIPINVKTRKKHQNQDLERLTPYMNFEQKPTDAKFATRVFQFLFAPLAPRCALESGYRASAQFESNFGRSRAILRKGIIKRWPQTGSCASQKSRTRLRSCLGLLS